MTQIELDKAGTFTLGDRAVKRIGYGAMQLAGPGVFGPPKDRDGALAVLREAVELGVDHIDTSDFYGPHITNQIIREALHPYRDDLTIVTKISARRDEQGRLAAGDVARGADRRRCTTTCATWAWTCWTWSTCAACSTSTARRKARSRSR